MIIVLFSLFSLCQVFVRGWVMVLVIWCVSMVYVLVFIVVGVFIIGGLLIIGLVLFFIVVVGVFMLIGLVIFVGFFGIVVVYEVGRMVGFVDLFVGFCQVVGSLWVLVLVCVLFFMIFMIDVVIFYSYMVGGNFVWLSGLLLVIGEIVCFFQWVMVFGVFIVFLLFCVLVFVVLLLCEWWVGLVDVVVSSVGVVFRNFLLVMFWVLLFFIVMIGSILFLFLLLFILLWFVYVSCVLYWQILLFV